MKIEHITVKINENTLPTDYHLVKEIAANTNDKELSFILSILLVAKSKNLTDDLAQINSIIFQELILPNLDK